MAAQARNTGDSIGDARADLAENPDSSNAHYNLGLALMHSVQPGLRAGTLDAAGVAVAREAEERLKHAIALASNHGRAHIMLGNMYRFTDRAPQALPHLQLAMGLPPESDDWLRACDGLASTQMLLNDAQSAIGTLTLGIKNHPTQAILHFKLGACFADRGRNPEAVTALESAIRLQPDYPEAQRLLQTVKPAPVAPGAIDYAKAAQETSRLGQELNDAAMKLMSGPGTPEEKTAKLTKMQEEFQRKVKALYGG